VFAWCVSVVGVLPFGLGIAILVHESRQPCSDPGNPDCGLGAILGFYVAALGLMLVIAGLLGVLILWWLSRRRRGVAE
jgi:uncharacterized Tic20 family protein